MKLAKASENKFDCEVLQLCYRGVNPCSAVGPQRDFAGRTKMSLTKPFGLQSEDLFKLSDEELMHRVAVGCQDALTTLFDRYQHLVF
jgi:hypothetical protein